ncbi:MAG TPA: efflux RND transporter permease subunit [Gemmataceae bacterium]|nr:efflux RND transporter permease subunit [Gemmataceae bacterium]
MNSSLNPIVFALRHPITMMSTVGALVVATALALVRMPMDIFPTLDLPVVYICQPYGGLSPSQMESQITAFLEGHTLYIGGIHHVESKTIQGAALVKIYFHPGTNMAQAMAETVGIVNRAHGYVPAGTLPPFIIRFDVSNVPIGYLVVDSSNPSRTPGELSDLTLQRVRPVFATLPGVSAPPPLGGNSRTIVLSVDPDRLRSYHLSPEDLVSALSTGNVVLPAGNARIRDQVPIVQTNALVHDPHDLLNIPVHPGGNLYLRDLCTLSDTSDTPTGYALVNGRRTVYLMVTKNADASTLAVVSAIKANLPRMQEALPSDCKVSFEFDQSPYVTRAMWGVASEGLLGAALTGLMVLLFLRDWRSVIVVVLNIPLALMGAVVALWVTWQTINLMTLGGLALAIGILVDEATVEVENIHSQMTKTESVALAVRRGNHETAVPRLLAMLCVLAVFLPMFFMVGAARNLFVPLALAVSFSMITSYVLSSTFVPVVSVWLLQRTHHAQAENIGFFSRVQHAYDGLLTSLLARPWTIFGAYIGACAAILLLVSGRLGSQIFPNVDTGQFLMRVRAATGTRIERTEEIAKKALDIIGEFAGPGNVETTVGYVGVTPPGFSNQMLYLWSSGPEEAILRVALKEGSGVRVDHLKERLRSEMPARMGKWLRERLVKDGLSPAEIEQRIAALRMSFGPADVINEVMSFGSPTPVEIVVYGTNPADNLAHAAKIKESLQTVAGLRDLQYGQSQDFPTVEVKIDREKVGRSKVTVQDVGRALLSVTSTSRYVVPVYWADLKYGQGYQVQIQVAPPRIDSPQEIGMIPIKQTATGPLLIRDVAEVREGTTPGEYDRIHLRRMVSLTANLEGNDLGKLATELRRAIAAAGAPPRGVRVELRGQIEPMEQMFSGLALGLSLAIVSIFILLTAYFQSLKLALTAVAAVPAVLSGVVLMLWITGTTLNIQSFMGAIMAVGVAVANAILLVTFAEKHRVEDKVSAHAAAREGAFHRLRPILMTSCAMLAGMIPMALALGEGGEQTAPLGRAVIGGLLAAMFATLLILPAVFTLVQSKSDIASPSLDPADPESRYFSPEAAHGL